MGQYVRSQFNRINGRVQYRALKDEYTLQFGEKYQEQFKRNIKEKSDAYLKTHGRDILNSYNNIIVWRNNFAHEGRLNETATLNEVISAYEDGKEIIHCLAETMQR